MSANSVLTDASSGLLPRVSLPHRGCRATHSPRHPLQGRLLRAGREGPQHRCYRAAAVPSDVFVVDFDGVLCNTEPELSISGYKSAAKYWPAVFADVDYTKQLRILDALARLRPVLVKGYEAMVMARLILEDPTSEELILQHWETALPEVLQKWDAHPDHLSAFSDGYRNASLLKDRHAWTHKNQLFVGVYQAMRGCEYPWYITSSKAAHRISALMGSLLGIDLPTDSPRLFASLNPPEESKIEALRTISQRPLVKESRARVHFIDDRYETVKAVRDAPGLSNVVVYLADWGYNTDTERRKAQEMSGIRVLSLTDFCELLRWGIIMGVDDGCEPSLEEVTAGVAR